MPEWLRVSYAHNPSPMSREIVAGIVVSPVLTISNEYPSASFGLSVALLLNADE